MYSIGYSHGEGAYKVKLMRLGSRFGYLKTAPSKATYWNDKGEAQRAVLAPLDEWNET